MKDNEIMIAEKMPTFKSKALNTATKAIYDAINAYNMTAAETRKTVSITLSRIEKGKTYKDDGFKSLAEYAETIGLDKSLAHKMENAGRMLDSENPVIKDFASKADYSKLAILSSADEKDVAAAIESGDLSPETTQADVKAWKATNAAKSAKAKVLPTYEVHIVFGNGRMLDFDSIELENIEALDGFTKVGSFKQQTLVSGSDDATKETTWEVFANEFTGDMLRLNKTKVKAAPKTKKPDVIDMTKLSDAQLQAMMQEYMRRNGQAGE